MFLIILTHKLTQYEQRQEAMEVKRGGRVNIYRLGHLLGALEKVREDVADVLDADDTASLNRLVRSIETRFTEFSPATATVKKIRAYQESGKLPALK